MPLILISPVRRIWLPSTCSPAAEEKVISGWLSASKKSGEVEVAVALRIVRVDAGDLDAALEDRGLAGGVDRALELAERAAHGRDAHVTDLEAHVRVGRIDVVGPGTDRVERKGGRAQGGLHFVVVERAIIVVDFDCDVKYCAINRTRHRADWEEPAERRHSEARRAGDRPPALLGGAGAAALGARQAPEERCELARLLGAEVL